MLTLEQMANAIEARAAREATLPDLRTVAGLFGFSYNAAELHVGDISNIGVLGVIRATSGDIHCSETVPLVIEEA